MDKTQIIIFSAAIAILGVRLYQKYIKKGTNKSEDGTKSSGDSSFRLSSKDDEYEPYSKR